MSKTTVCERSNRDLLGVFTNIGSDDKCPINFKNFLDSLEVSKSDKFVLFGNVWNKSTGYGNL